MVRSVFFSHRRAAALQENWADVVGLRVQSRPEDVSPSGDPGGGGGSLNLKRRVGGWVRGRKMWPGGNWDTEGEAGGGA